MSIWKKIKKKQNNLDPLIIQNYIGYASPQSVFLKGRILENEIILKNQTDGSLQNLLENIKRFKTDEVAGAKVQVDLYNKTWTLKTDREGYFTLDSAWRIPQGLSSQWLEASVHLEDISEYAEIYFASPEAQYGVISDIDDTVLQTDVSSFFKLKMFYNTFFKDAHQRVPMEGIVELFSRFAEGQNPIFYISHSPWNLYNTLLDFMEIQNLPKGPILLRDYGIKPIGNFHDHKLQSIKRILQMHPNLPFIMLGDTADQDADFYLALAKDFPGQISAIYIRQTKDTKNARRVKALIEERTHHGTDVILSETSKGMVEHAKAKGYIS